MKNESRDSDSLPIFALSIDEEIKWAAPSLYPANEYKFREDDFGNSTHYGHFPIPSNFDQPIQHWLRSQLERLREARPNLFLDRRAIGVSSIGLVGETSNSSCLFSLQRKPSWRAPKSHIAVINFTELFSGLFEHKNIPLVVKNDATSKAIAETANLDSPEFPLVYITIGEGINCGIVVNYNDLRTALHPEMGHARPLRHPDDNFIDFIHSGCPAHTDCYEALASGGRIKARWGLTQSTDLLATPDHQQWGILAYYVSQACWTLTTIIAPRMIVLGGSLASDNLLEKVKRGFLGLNAGYISYAGMEVIDKFIKLGNVQPEHLDLLGAMHLAYSAAIPARGKIAFPTQRNSLLQFSTVH